MDTIKIYALDGSLQCGLRGGIDPDVMERSLTALNIRVMSRGKQIAPLMVPAMCGAPTGMANVYEIDVADLEKIPKDNGIPKFLPWLFDAKTVDVYKPDGSLQCFGNDAISLDVNLKELTDAGITVLDNRKDVDNLVHPQMCGLPTGRINAYTINVDDFLAAQKLGFSLLSINQGDTHTVSGTSGGSAPQGFWKEMFENRVISDDRFVPWPWQAGKLARDPGDAWPWSGKSSNTKLDGPSLSSLLPRIKNHELISELEGMVCRVIHPGDQVTLDLRSNRANIFVDENNVITSIKFF